MKASPEQAANDDETIESLRLQLRTNINDRKRVEAQLADEKRLLEKSESRLRIIIDTIPTIAWCTLADGSGEFWNQRWHDYTGLPLEAARGWGWETVIYPEDLSTITTTWRKDLAAGQAGEVEGRLRRSDGQYRWFLFRYCPFRDESGKIVNWYGTNTDIEDRRRAETLLAGEKRLLEMVAGGHALLGILEALCELVESSSSGCYCSVVLLDPTGTHLEHGAAPSLPASFITSIVGRPVNADSGPCAMAAHLNEQVISADLASETRWGNYEWCPMALAHGLRACWSTPIRSTTGKVLGAFAIYYDAPGLPASVQQNLVEQFTHFASIAIERAQNDAAVKRSEESLRAMVETTPECVKVIARDGTLLRVNAAGLTMAGAPSEDAVLGQCFYDFLAPEDRERYRTFNETVCAGRKGFLEFDIISAQGERRNVETHAAPMRHGDGSIVQLGVTRDITERKRAEKELRQSEAGLRKAQAELAHVTRVTTMGELAASIAHEVNQPIAGVVINGNACLRWLAHVKEESANLTEARETLQRIIRDGNRAGEIVARIRALFNKTESIKEPLDLNETIREVIVLVRNEMDKQRVVLRLEMPLDLPRVVGDRVQLQQVMLNLLLNAIEAMAAVEGRDRDLVIQTRSHEEGTVLITVRDSGTGLDLADQERIFTAFHTTKPAGLGMGLSISRSIVENHSGRLWATANEGAGATFQFTLATHPGQGRLAADR